MLKTISNISLRTKLVTCFFLIISINSIFGYTSIKIMSKLGETVNITYDRALMSGTFAQASKFDYSQFDSEVKAALLATDLEEFNKHRLAAVRAYNTLIDDLGVVEERALGEKSGKLAKDLILQLTNVEKLKNAVLAEKIVLLSEKKDINLIKLEKSWDENKAKSLIYKKLTALYDEAAEVGYSFRMSSEEENKKNLNRTIILLISCSLIGIFLSVIISFVFIKPLFKLGETCKKVGEGDYATRSNISSKDEFGTLASSFNFMLSMIEEKNDNISSLLFSLPFGLFYFDHEGNISKERSRATDLFFSNFSSYKNLTDFYNDHGFENRKIQNIVDATFKGLIPFDSAVFLFPDIVLTERAGEKRTIELSFKPKYGVDNKLERVILIAEDVTEKNMALEASKVLSERVERVSKVSYDVPGFKEFLPATKALFDECKTMISKLDNDNETELKRSLHSLKGLLGIFSFNTCAADIHAIEEMLAEYGVEKINDIKTRITESQILFDSQAEDIVNLLSLNNSSGLKYFNSSKVSLIKELVKKENNPKLLSAFDNLDKFSLETVLAKYSTHAFSIASKLENKKVKMIFEPSDDVSFEEVQRLDAVLIHVLNNSIDHGIETSDERIGNNKNAVGEIKISCKRNPDQSLVFKISDDGKGINGEYLLQKALELGLINSSHAETMTEEDKVNLIYISGLSSKSESNITSGRGIGMDAVKSYIESIGGRIDLLTNIGVGTTFSLKIPALNAV